MGNRVSPKQAMQGMLDADVVVFHRPFERERKEIFKILKDAGKKLVFSNDDTYIDEKQNYGVGDLAKKVNDELMWFATNSDLITTTTEFLKQEYLKYNPNVVVLPNCVDPDDFPKVKAHKNKKVRLGLIGSVVGTNDFDHIQDLLKELSLRDDIEIVVMSTKPNDGKFFDTIKVEWHEPVKVAEYFEKINDLKLDIMLIPRRESYFNKCKSNLKFLEASMLEIPCITDDWQDNPYTKDSDYLVTTHNWKKDLEDLIQDKELRKAIAKRAKKYVLKNYNIKDKKDLWTSVYETLNI
jgi:glycosyltransferase involved in cell wall biosynthesis